MRRLVDKLIQNRRDILEPGLVGRGLAPGLQLGHLAVGVVALEVVIGELVVIPGADKGPARPGCLQLGVGQVGPVEVAVIRQRHGVAIVLGGDAVGERRYPTGQGAAVGPGVPAAFVDEVTQVQDELYPLVCRRRGIVREQARPGAVVGVLVILAADEGEFDIALLAGGRGGAGLSHSGAGSGTLGECACDRGFTGAGVPGQTATGEAAAEEAAAEEAVVVCRVRFQPIEIGPDRVVTGGIRRQWHLQQRLGKVVAPAELQEQRHFPCRVRARSARRRQGAGPQHDTRRPGVAGSHALGKAQGRCIRTERGGGTGVARGAQEETAGGQQPQQDAASDRHGAELFELDEALTVAHRAGAM